MESNLVIFGASNILSDIFDCALSNRMQVKKIVLHHPEVIGERDRGVHERVRDLAVLGQFPEIIPLESFKPEIGEVYLLGPTTPSRVVLAEELRTRFQLSFISLVHPSAYVSPLAKVGEGVFVGANSVVGPGVTLADHVFVNRGVTIGHDTRIGSYTRIQPGSNLGGLSQIGSSVTVGIGATLIERLIIGDRAFIGAGAVVTADVIPDVLVTGIPAKIKKHLKSE